MVHCPVGKKHWKKIQLLRNIFLYFSHIFFSLSCIFFCSLASFSLSSPKLYKTALQIGSSSITFLYSLYQTFSLTFSFSLSYFLALLLSFFPFTFFRFFLYLSPIFSVPQIFGKNFFNPNFLLHLTHIFSLIQIYFLSLFHATLSLSHPCFILFFLLFSLFLSLNYRQSCAQCYLVA